VLNKREIILNTAERLFYAEGYHAVGIDRIIDEAGVAKMTMYKHFASKAELIVAVLQERDARLQKSLQVFVDAINDPGKKLKAVFSWHDRWFNEPDFNGCMFINAAIEYSNPDDDIHQVSRQHKQNTLAYLSKILDGIVEKKRARKLAGQMLQILEGAIITRHIFNDRNAALTAWQTAAALLKAEGLVNVHDKKSTAW
jgi:AcrR family transcriptional regulator